MVAAIELEHRIAAFCWLKESIKAIVAIYPTLVSPSRASEKNFIALQICLQFLEKTEHQLKSLQKKNVKEFLNRIRPDELTYDLLEQFWEKGIQQNKNKYLFSPASDPKDNLVTILNERDNNHFIRMVGLILQDAQANHLDPKHRKFISRIASNFIFNPYLALQDFASLQHKTTLSHKKFSKEELHAMIHRLIFIDEHIGKKACKKKDLSLLKALQKKLEENKTSEKEANEASQKILSYIFMQKAKQHRGIDNLIKILNTNFDRHIFYREVGLILQNQFHSIATRRWERKIYDMRHFHLPPIVSKVFKQMHI